MGNIGWTGIIIIAVLIVILFGKGKISSIMGDLAKGIKSFKIGWLEILAIVIIAIMVLGPKEFPIALKKIGSYFGKLKNTLSSFQREVNSVTENIDLEDDINRQEDDKKKSSNNE